MTNEAQNRILRAINNTSHSFIVIGEELNEAINGNRYVADALLSIATSSYHDIGIVTPSDKSIRLCGVDIGCDLNYAKCLIYEGVTFTGSTQKPFINSNRQSENNSGAILYSEFSVAPNITNATLIDTIATLGGTFVGGTSFGGSSEGDTFFILKKNTKYLFRISNEDGDTANVLFKIPIIETDLTD